MPLALDFICPFPNGVHARPACALAKAARRFMSEVTLTNTRTGKSANSKSVLAVIGTGIRQSDACRLSVSGSDEATAVAALSCFLSKIFPYSDEAPPASRAGAANATNPTSSALSTKEEVCGLFHPGLIVTDAGCTTKADAIRHAVNLLHAADRIEQPREFERSIWRREAVSSTGFGHGFAIPHCRSAAVLVDSLVILKLQTPVDWGSIDHQPVRFLILMAIREIGGHMTILSQLARKLMEGAFRERLVGEPNPAALQAFLKVSLDA